jgi:hypothetical protein
MESVTDLNKEKIQDYLKSHKTKLHTLGVESLQLFGSVARREANNSSDIDFLVTFKYGMKNFDNYMDLIFLLEDLFQVKVDLFTTESISNSMKKYIKEDTLLIEV